MGPQDSTWTGTYIHTCTCIIYMRLTVTYYRMLQCNTHCCDVALQFHFHRLFLLQIGREKEEAVTVSKQVQKSLKNLEKVWYIYTLYIYRVCGVHRYIYTLYTLYIYCVCGVHRTCTCT